ncbi:PH domain-containing protein [Pedobacter petrophilus]|uniref:PH domain-containing protein n=1 Tax=Pedobacter petrophilus TaxID=1908241 RepID=A0A7K0FU87_9SPHI|nr:PH domain-containing protein [Pedobacter petrophilus]MRX75173.1 PH domain-containing protein [Pedobacter petrophilus]
MLTENFTNEAIDISTLPKFEQVVLKKLHPDYWKIMCINLVLFFLPLAIGIALLLFFVDDFRPYIALMISAYAAIIVISTLLFYISFKKRGYALRTKDLIYKSGIISDSTTIVPLNRIQHIELNESIFSRMYHLGSLQIFTAGGHSGHLHISGIPIAEAKSIRDLLLQKLDLIHQPSTDPEALHG